MTNPVDHSNGSPVSWLSLTSRYVALIDVANGLGNVPAHSTSAVIALVIVAWANSVPNVRAETLASKQIESSLLSVISGQSAAAGTHRVQLKNNTLQSVSPLTDVAVHRTMQPHTAAKEASQV